MQAVAYDLGLTGLAVSLCAAVSLVVLAIKFFAFGVPFNGFGTLISVMLIGFGAVTLLLGLIAEYIALIYEEVKHRPNFIVTKKVGL